MSAVSGPRRSSPIFEVGSDDKFLQVQRIVYVGDERVSVQPCDTLTDEAKARPRIQHDDIHPSVPSPRLQRGSICIGLMRHVAAIGGGRLTVRDQEYILIPLLLGQEFSRDIKRPT